MNITADKKGHFPRRGDVLCSQDLLNKINEALTPLPKGGTEMIQEICHPALKAATCINGRQGGIDHRASLRNPTCLKSVIDMDGCV